MDNQEITFDEEALEGVQENMLKEELSMDEVTELVKRQGLTQEAWQILVVLAAREAGGNTGTFTRRLMRELHLLRITWLGISATRSACFAQTGWAARSSRVLFARTQEGNIWYKAKIFLPTSRK